VAMPSEDDGVMSSAVIRLSGNGLTTRMVPHRFMYEEEEEDDDERTKIPGTNEMENIIN
jgi:hypothetical protein